MRIPMPSPRGSNLANLYLHVPAGAGVSMAFDAAPRRRFAMDEVDSRGPEDDDDEQDLGQLIQQLRIEPQAADALRKFLYRVKSRASGGQDGPLPFRGQPRPGGSMMALDSTERRFPDFNRLKRCY